MRDLIKIPIFDDLGQVRLKAIYDCAWWVTPVMIVQEKLGIGYFYSMRKVRWRYEWETFQSN